MVLRYYVYPLVCESFHLWCGCIGLLIHTPLVQIWQYAQLVIHTKLILKPHMSWSVRSLIDGYLVHHMSNQENLGGASSLFPGAEHTRFIHSLGVYENARIMLKKIDIKISALDREAILSAALLHDLGHGPFSHTLEFLCNDYDHEYFTNKIINTDTTEVNKILSKHNPKLPQLIVDIISGKHNVKWYTQIISSQLDADRMDYLIRDSKISGLSYGIVETNRILNTIQVFKNEIVFSKKSISAIESFLMGRYHMYEILYMHPKNISFDYLMVFIFNRLRKLNKEGFGFKTNIELIKPILSCSFTIETLSKLTDYSVTWILEALSEEEDEMLNKLITKFKEGKVLKYVELNSKKEIKEFTKNHNPDEKNLLWTIGIFDETKIYDKTKKNGLIKILDNDKVYDITDKSKMLSSLSENKKQKKKVYGFYYG